MRILFCAAEQEELDCAKIALRPFESKIAEKVKIEFMLTGIGSTAVAYSVTKKIWEARMNGQPYTLVINIGIAGSYNLDKFPIGSVAIVEEERFGDLGFMTKNGFTSLFDSKYIDSNTFPFVDGVLKMTKLQDFFNDIIKDIPKAKGVTVQTISEGVDLAQKKRDEYEIESMEGGGFFYVCLCEYIHFIEIRTVSNKVGEADTSKWDTSAALDTLTQTCKEFFSKIANR